MLYFHFRLIGNYEALDGGELAEALEDFTGGIAEPIDIVGGKYNEDPEKREELFAAMKKAHNNRALQAAAIPVCKTACYNHSKCYKQRKIEIKI